MSDDYKDAVYSGVKWRPLTTAPILTKSILPPGKPLDNRQALQLLAALDEQLLFSDAHRCELIERALGVTIISRNVLEVARLARAQAEVRYRPIRTRLRRWWTDRH